MKIKVLKIKNDINGNPRCKLLFGGQFNITLKGILRACKDGSFNITSYCLEDSLKRCTDIKEFDFIRFSSKEKKEFYTSNY